MESKLHSVRNIETLRDLINGNAALFGDKPALLPKEKKGGEYFEISFSQFKRDVDALGTKLIDMGLKGEKIAVMGNNSYQWVVAYFAIINGAGIVVPLDKELKKEEIENLIKTAGCKAVFFTQNYTKYFDDMDIEYKFKMDAYEIKENMTIENHIYSLINDGMILLEQGNDAYINAELDPNEMRVILFTSGTTGTPKGVMLCHRNLCRVIMSTSQIVKLYDGDRSLSLLPIHHTFESTIGILVMLYQGASVAFCEGLKYVLKNLQESQASMLVGVPLIVESIYNKIWKEAEKTKKDKVLKKAIKLNKFLLAMGIDKRRVIFKSVYKNFGGKLRLVICGAAALDPNVLRGFVDLGFDLTQGYGLTETAPLVAGVPDFGDIYRKAGSCGPAIPEVDIKIDNPNEDGIGEILIKGDNVMLGYYNMPEATKEVFTEDGYFKSGDLGFLDKDGWVYLTGRSKNVIVTKTGKNIYPEEIEIIVNANKFVEESMVYGVEGEKNEDTIITVQIKPDEAALKEENLEEYTKDQLQEFFKEEIYKINVQLPSYKRIKNIIIREEDFIRTTTKKIIRKANM
ncbi:MAG: AMP-binding protein [Anaerovoracaceae bacterium]